MSPERVDVPSLSQFRYTPTASSHPKTRRRTGTPTQSVSPLQPSKGVPQPESQDIAALYDHLSPTYPRTPALRTTYKTPSGKRVPPHHWAVYDATLLVPPGKVTTYKALCAFVRAGSPRSVGGALRNNPFAPWVPCHRVVATDLFVGGFKGEWKGRSRGVDMNVGGEKDMGGEKEEGRVVGEVGVNWHEKFKGKGLGVLQREKLRLLALEGVAFDPENGKLVDPSAFLWTFEKA